MKYSFGGGLGSRSCFFLSALLSSFFPFFYEHSFVSGYMPQLLGPCNWLTQVYFGLPVVSIFFYVNPGSESLPMLPCPWFCFGSGRPHPSWKTKKSILWCIDYFQVCICFGVYSCWFLCGSFELYWSCPYLLQQWCQDCHHGASCASQGTPHIPHDFLPIFPNCAHVSY